MSEFYNGLRKSFGTSFPNEDDVPRYDQGNESHASLPPPPPIVLPDPQVQWIEKINLTQALLASKHADGKPVCAHVLEMKSRIDRLRMLGVDISEMLAVYWVLRSLPDSYRVHLLLLPREGALETKLPYLPRRSRRWESQDVWLYFRIEEKKGNLMKKRAESDHEEMDFDRMDSKIGFLSCCFRVRVDC
ncbi:unnamed protein product [Lactuca saligna]|uniref:Uncharacterized protein n=1 Tax=Lactuca saligna TaxID=75948 RepID=A0AA35ZVT0_LACSI|nr:unnamed protein product [Lactuca saligna]